MENNGEIPPAADPTSQAESHVEQEKSKLNACNSCQFNLEYVIKCWHCKTILCFSCSMLPKENFLYFFLTCAQYRCKSCCTNDLTTRNKNPEEHFGKLEEEIKEFENRVKNCVENRDQINQTQNLVSSANNSQNNTPPNQVPLNFPDPPTTEPEDPPPKPDCIFFLRGFCKETRDSCRFTHPQLCSKYMRGRENKRLGCRKTKDTCGYKHPPVCFQLEDHGFCELFEIGKCKFFHRKNAMKNHIEPRL